LIDQDAVGLVIALDPILLRIGPVSLRWYGFFLTLGLAAGLLVALRAGRRRGIDDDSLWAAVLVSAIAGLAGARLFHVLDKIDYYAEHLSEALGRGPGGLAIWGAVICGLAGLAVYARLRRLPFGHLADTAALAVLAGACVGRLGSIVNGDSWGAPTNHPWAFIYTNPDAALPASLLGMATHPYPVYEILWNAVSLVLLASFGRRTERGPRPGLLATLYLILFACGRLVLGALRQETVLAFGLQQSQVVAAAVLLVSLPLAVYLITVRAATKEGGSAEV
jgi:phosphatidylglycerol---prolipoprotein diacylglyceryl transferase